MGHTLTKPTEERAETIRNQMLHADPTPEHFKKTEDSLTWCEKYYFGYVHQVWKTACLYKFLMDEKTRTNIGYGQSDLICQYTDIEQEVVDGYNKGCDWAVLPMAILKNVTGKRKYKQTFDKRLSDEMVSNFLETTTV